MIDEGIILWFPGIQKATQVKIWRKSMYMVAKLSFNLCLSQSLRSKIAEWLNQANLLKLAFQNGKINLLKAESIGDLISSETEIQMKQALKIIAGNNLKKFEHWRNELLKILSHIEAKIDFPDEDLPENILEKY